MKIYTYFEEINYIRQKEILKCWEKTWKNHGFETFILSRSDAEKHPLFITLCSKLDEKNLLFFGKKFSDTLNRDASFHLASIIRWLAWAHIVKEPSIVGDFDILNNGFILDEPIEDNLIFRDEMCLSLSSGNGNHFENFIKCLIENLDTFYKETNMVEDNKNRGFFHDQDFIYQMCRSKNIAYFEKEYNFRFSRYPVKNYDFFDKKMKNTKLLHVSHFCINHIFKKHIRENLQNEKILKFVAKLNEDAEHTRASFAENISNGIFYDDN
jgi:hypothetical protein